MGAPQAQEFQRRRPTPTAPLPAILKAFQDRIFLVPVLPEVRPLWETPKLLTLDRISRRIKLETPRPVPPGFQPEGLFGIRRFPEGPPPADRRRPRCRARSLEGRIW